MTRLQTSPCFVPAAPIFRPLLASWLLTGALALSGMNAAFADDPATAISLGDGFDARRVLAAEELARMRGGFLSGDANGLEISFGIERSVSINGDIVSTTRFGLPALAENGRVPRADLASLYAVQNGDGNRIALAPSQQSPGSTLSIVQNSLDNQVIRQSTVISASVQSLEMMRSNAAWGAITRQQFLLR